jgi:hypothetical protein
MNSDEEKRIAFIKCIDESFTTKPYRRAIFICPVIEQDNGNIPTDGRAEVSHRQDKIGLGHSGIHGT